MSEISKIKRNTTTLRLAKRQAGFDYDKYFRAYASL